MLKSEFDEYQALHHHDMGVSVASVFGKPVTVADDADEYVEPVVLAGSPLCVAAQINRTNPEHSVPALRKSNCKLQWKPINVSSRREGSVASTTILILATKRINAHEELLCKYAARVWIDAASCMIRCKAIEKSDFDQKNDSSPSAIECRGFIKGQPCPFSVHRQCLIGEGLVEPQQYCHYCFRTSAGEDPQPDLLSLATTITEGSTVEEVARVEPLKGVITSSASFATVLNYAHKQGLIVISVQSCNPLPDGTVLVKYDCERVPIEASSHLVSIIPSSIAATELPSYDHRSDSVELRPAHRAASATGQALAAPRRLLSDVLQQMSLNTAVNKQFENTALNAPGSSPSLLISAPAVVQTSATSSNLTPLSGPNSTATPLQGHANAHSGALSELAAHLSAAGYAEGDWIVTGAANQSDVPLDKALLREMRDWNQPQMLQQLYGVMNLAAAAGLEPITAEAEGSPFHRYIDDLITYSDADTILLESPCSSYRKTFHLVHCAGRPVITAWLAGVFQHHLHSIDLATREAITQLFRDARDLLMEQCISFGNGWDESIERCYDEWFAKDWAIQKSQQESELAVLVNHCSGILGDHMDDDNIVDAPLITAFLTTHIQELETRWRPMVMQHRGVTQSDCYQKECEGLLYAALFAFLRRISYQLNDPESPVPHWGVGSLQVMMERQQKDIIEYIRTETWSDAVALQQVRQADDDRAHRLRVAFSRELPFTLQLTGAEVARRDLAVALQYLVHLTRCASYGVTVAAPRLHSRSGFADSTLSTLSSIAAATLPRISSNLATLSGAAPRSSGDSIAVSLSEDSVFASSSIENWSEPQNMDVSTEPSQAVDFSSLVDTSLDSTYETESDAEPITSSDGEQLLDGGDDSSSNSSDPSQTAPMDTSDSDSDFQLLADGSTHDESDAWDSMVEICVTDVQRPVTELTSEPNTPEVDNTLERFEASSAAQEASDTGLTATASQMVASHTSAPLSPSMHVMGESKSSTPTSSAASSDKKRKKAPIPSRDSVTIRQARIDELTALHQAHMVRSQKAAALSKRHQKQVALGRVSKRGQRREEKHAESQAAPPETHCEGLCSVEAFLQAYQAFDSCCAQQRREHNEKMSSTLRDAQASELLQQVFAESKRHHSVLYTDGAIVGMYQMLLEKLEESSKTDRKQEFFRTFRDYVLLRVKATLAPESSVEDEKMERTELDVEDGQGGDGSANALAAVVQHQDFATRLSYFDLNYGSIPVCLYCYIRTHSWLRESTVRKWVNEIVESVWDTLSVSYSKSLTSHPRARPATGQHGNSFRSRPALKEAAVTDIIRQVARARGDAAPDANVTSLIERTQPHVHALVIEELRTGAYAVDGASLSTVKRALNKMSDIKLSGKHATLPQCDTCVAFFANTRPTEEQKEAHQLHQKMQESERAELAKNIALAKKRPNEYLYIAIDGMDQAKTELPHLCQMPHWRGDASFTALKVHVTGVMVHGPDQTLVFTHYQNVHTGGSLTAHLLHLSLRKVWKGIEETTASTVQAQNSPRCPQFPKTLTLQMDNSGKDNKNNTVFQYLALLVARGIFETVLVHFLIVGHTHDRVDQMFSCISRELQTNDALTHIQLADSIKNGYTRDSVASGRKKSGILPAGPSLGRSQSGAVAGDDQSSGESGPDADERFTADLTLDPLCRQRPEVIHVDHIADWDSFVEAFVSVNIKGMTQCQVFKIHRNFNGDVEFAAKEQTNILIPHRNKRSGALEITHTPRDFSPGTIIITRDSPMPTTDPVQHPSFKFPFAELRQSGRIMTTQSNASSSELTASISNTVTTSKEVMRRWNADTHRVWDAEIDRVASVVAESQCAECAHLISELDEIHLPGQRKVKQMSAAAAAGVLRDEARKRSLRQSLRQHMANTALHSRYQGLWTAEFQPCTAGLVDPVQRMLGQNNVSEARLAEDNRIRLQIQTEIDASEGKELVESILNRLSQGTEEKNRTRLLKALNGRPDDPIITITPKRKRVAGVSGDVVQHYPVRLRPSRRGDIVALNLDNYLYPEYRVSLALVRNVQKQKTTRKKRRKQSRSRGRAGSQPSDDSKSESDQEAADAEVQKEADGKTIVTVVYYYLQFPNYASACAMLDRKIEHFKEHGLHHILWEIMKKWDPTVSAEAASKSGDAMEADDEDNALERSASESDTESPWKKGRGRRRGTASNVADGGTARNRKSHQLSGGSVAEQRRAAQQQASLLKDQLAKGAVVAPGDSHSHPRALPTHPTWSSLYELWIPIKSIEADMKLMDKKKKGGKFTASETLRMAEMDANKLKPYTWHATFDNVNDEFTASKPTPAKLKQIPPFFQITDYETVGIRWQLLEEKEQVTQSVMKEELMCWMRKDEALDDLGNITLSFAKVLEAGIAEFQKHHGWYANDDIEDDALPSGRENDDIEDDFLPSGREGIPHARAPLEADTMMESGVDVDDGASTPALMGITSPAVPVASALLAKGPLTRSSHTPQLTLAVATALTETAEDMSDSVPVLNAATSLITLQSHSASPDLESSPESSVSEIAIALAPSM